MGGRELPSNVGLSLVGGGDPEMRGELGWGGDTQRWGVILCGGGRCRAMGSYPRGWAEKTDCGLCTGDWDGDQLMCRVDACW